MVRDYIRIGDKSYRVEANWNATADFCRRMGISKLSEMDHLGDIDAEGLLILMHACMKEGERMDGRDIDLTVEDLGAVVNTAKMKEFIDLYGRQSTMSPAAREAMAAQRGGDGGTAGEGNGGSKKKS